MEEQNSCHFPEDAAGEQLFDFASSTLVFGVGGVELTQCARICASR